MFSLYVQILQSLIQLCNCLCSNVVSRIFYDIAVLLFHETFGQNPLLDSQVPALNRHIPLKLLHHFYRLITVIHIPLIRLLFLFTYYGGVAFHHEQVTEALFRLCIIFLFIYSLIVLIIYLSDTSGRFLFNIMRLTRFLPCIVSIIPQITGLSFI